MHCAEADLPGDVLPAHARVDQQLVAMPQMLLTDPAEYRHAKVLAENPEELFLMRADPVRDLNQHRQRVQFLADQLHAARRTIRRRFELQVRARTRRHLGRQAGLGHVVDTAVQQALQPFPDISGGGSGR